MQNINFITPNVGLFPDLNGIGVSHDLEPVFQFLDTYDWIGVDTETTGLNPHKDRILLLVIGNEHEQFVIDTAIDCTPVIEELVKHNKILHHAKFDYKMIRAQYGIKLEYPLWDTMLAHKVMYNGLYRANQASLADLHDFHFLPPLNKSTRNSFIGFKGIFREDQIKYAAQDVEYLCTIRENQIHGTDTKKGLEVYDLVNTVELENRVTLAFADMEYEGIYLDSGYWLKEVLPYYKQEQKELKDTLDDTLISVAKVDDNHQLKKYIPTALDLFTGEPTATLHVTGRKTSSAPSKTGVNWASSKQIISLLHNELGYNLTYKDVKKGEVRISSGNDVLYNYCTLEVKNYLEAKDYENAKKYASNLIDYILLYRVISKVVSSYGENFVELVDSATGRIHPSFRQLGTDTGRASSKDPNLQNIPKQQKFRSAFKAPKGYMITADYSGAELRIIAEGSKETVMINAFNSGEDVHGMMASIAYGMEVTKTKNKDKRSKIKNVNFGLAYGASAKSDKIRKAFDTAEEAEQFLKTYFKKFPGLERFFKHLKTVTTTHGYSKTFPPFGRIRWYDGFPMYNKMIHDKALKELDPGAWNDARFQISKFGRAGMNQPIQGTSADIMKLAMIYIRERLINTHSDLKLVNQVHDEVVIEVNSLDKEYVENIAEQVKDLMVEAGQVVIKSLTMEVEYDIDTVWKK